MPATASIRRGFGALAALVAAGALAVPAHAEAPSDAYPSPQAIATNAEFLAQVPAPAGGAGNVCVIDTGVTPLPDTASQIVERLALDGGTLDDVDHVAGDARSGHGSFVAGAIASQIDGRGSAGIWPAAKIISVRVFRSASSGATPGDYMTAINECGWQSDRNVRVITISIGVADMGAYELSKLEDRITDIHRNWNINVVAAAGNDGDSSAVSYPARIAAAFAVGATGAGGAFCRFSNRGTGLDISSLGCNLQMSGFDGSAHMFAGTSYATPTVAGILLALRAHRPYLSATQAEQLLLDHAQHTSAGRVVDAAAAFRAAGLGHLVDAYKPPVPTGDNGGDAGDNTVDDERPARPRLIAATFKRGVMRVRVAKPRRGFAATFRVNGRSYVRGSGALTLRVRSWKSVSVLIEDKWGVRSEPLKVRRPGRR